MIYGRDTALAWWPKATPILQGRASTGIFSFAFIDELNGIIVGGDYKADSLKDRHVFLTHDGGETWSAPALPTRGYRECVAYLTKKIVIATGPSGTDISYDGGNNWSTLSDEKGYHVVRKARKGKLVIIAGSGGKISVTGL